MLTIVSWGGVVLNNETFTSGFNPGDIWGLPNIVAESLAATGSWPVRTVLDREQQYVQFYVALNRLSSVRADRATLLAAFNPEDNTSKQLLIEDSVSGRSRYITGICTSLKPIKAGNMAVASLFKVTIAIDGDVRWNAVSTVSDTWNITASGQTRVITVTGEDEVFPIYRFTPTVAKTGDSYIYRRWLPVIWRSRNSADKYPLMVSLDTETLITAGKMKADGGDIRILVDGKTATRWVDSVNTPSTKVWFRASYSTAPVLLLKTTIPAVGDIASIEVEDNVELALMPDMGIVLIDNEAFTYSNRDLVGGALTGISRAAKGTSAAEHLASGAKLVYWIQNDIYMLYGNPSAATPTSVAYRPMFDIGESDNENWIYDGKFRYQYSTAGGTAAWQHSKLFTLSGLYGAYGATERTMSGTQFVTSIGTWRDVEASGPDAFSTAWRFSNPCGIVNVGWDAGKKRRLTGATSWNCKLKYWIRGDSWWTPQKLIEQPVSDDTWESWDFNKTLAEPDWEPADKISFVNYQHPGDLEAGWVHIKLNGAEYPLASVNAEEGNYRLTCTLSNNGDSFEIDFVMDLNETLEVDTLSKIVAYLKDDSRNRSALTVGTTRKEWLKLSPGANTLTFTDVGTQGVTLVTIYRNRYY